jgi:RNA polymerase sigma factor (sigma-70 family)
LLDEGVTGVRIDDVAPRVPFDEVFAAEREPMVRVAFLVVGSQAVAEELVQDAFMALYPRFERIDNAAAYVRTSVVRGALRWRRRHAMEAERALRLVEPGPTGVDTIDETWDALERLKPERRAVLVLRFYADLDHAQIAELVGCPVATVRTRLHRGLADLRKELEQ